VSATKYHFDKMRRTDRRTSTSPAPGSGVSSSSSFVEMVPGLSYTIALYLLGTTNVFSVATAAMFMAGGRFECLK